MKNVKKKLKSKIYNKTVSVVEQSPRSPVTVSNPVIVGKRR